MNVDKYQMSKRDKDILQRHHVYLTENITPSGSFIGNLFAKDLLTHNQKEEVQVRYNPIGRYTVTTIT